MARPRRRSSRAVSATGRAPTAASAAYSPSVTGDKAAVIGEADIEFSLQRPHHGERYRHQRRLGVLGQAQVIVAALEDQRRQFFIQRIVDFVEDIARGREVSARSRPMPIFWLPCPENESPHIVLVLAGRSESSGAPFYALVRRG